MICRYCKKEVDEGNPVKTLSYWNQIEFVCHSSCKKNGERQEATDCQTIDADCNDCKFFQRTAKFLDSIPKGIVGHCTKFDKQMIAYPHFFTGHECFEHRRL